MTEGRLIGKGLAGIIAACFLLATHLPEAAQIRLDDGTTMEADVARVEDETVLLRLPRSRVKSVNDETLSPAVKEGALAPVFSATDLSGKKQRVGPKTKRATILHFWVHWCPHCRADASQLQQLFERFKERTDVQVLTVNLDQDRAGAEQFVAERSVTYPVIFAKEEASDLAQRYGMTAFPTTFVIDRQGIIRRKIVGSFAESDTDLAEIIDPLL